MIYVCTTGRSNDNVSLMENYTVDKMKVINQLNFVFGPALLKKCS